MTKNMISLILIVAAFVLGVTLGPQVFTRDEAGMAGEGTETAKRVRCPLQRVVRMLWHTAWASITDANLEPGE